MVETGSSDFKCKALSRSSSRCNINTLYDITETTRRNISRVRNMGDKGVKEVDDKLKEYGLHFKAEEIQ